MSLTPAKQRFVDLASTKYGIGANVNKEEVFSVVTENKIGWPSWFTNKNYRVDRGEWKLPT